MLTSLSIRDVVLIDRLDLSFSDGLSVLTGETGAGKSILLDALGFVLGARADSGLVRAGTSQATVIAGFDIGSDHPAQAILKDQGMTPEDGLLLRRILTSDGRSRGFVNDQPASAGLLRQLGQTLVEIQGQFEQHGLLDPASHLALLDAYAAEPRLIAEIAESHAVWRRAAATLAGTKSDLAKARAEEEWLRHTLAELDALDPQPDEEAGLVERRAYLMHRAQVVEAVEAATTEISGDRGAIRALNAAARSLEKARDKAGGRLDGVVAALERALIEADECANALDLLGQDPSESDDRLDKVEQRLFDLRALARKHSVTVEQLGALQADTAARLAAIESGDDGLKQLMKAESEARALFYLAAKRLSAERRKAAQSLQNAVMGELPALKLERARFAVTLVPLDEAQWNGQGAERVSFEVATNPGSSPGPLGKIASAGELSRFLLALKLALARVSSVPTLVFDEVDSGIGGATAAAVGERLQRLGTDLQVLVVTHSPQVAARGAQHWRISKHVEGERTTTRVEPLDRPARREEIARMLAGSEVTKEARAAADSLLGPARKASAKPPEGLLL